MTESRNIDELKRLVISALDKSGALSELRSTVKLHVARAINEEAPIVHLRNDRVDALMATERGQLLTELVVEFLRFYDLKDTLSMLAVEAALPRLRPSEPELAAQCGCSYSRESSVIEQYLARHTNELHFAPQHDLGHTKFDTDAPIHTPPGTGQALDQDDSPLLGGAALGQDDSPLLGGRALTQDNSPLLGGGAANGFAVSGDFSPVSEPGNTSLELDMHRMRNISHEIERISLSSVQQQLKTDGGSPRYDEDEFEPESPLVTQKMKRMDDDVLFESRESLVDLGVAPASKFPIDRNDRFEPAERSS